MEQEQPADNSAYRVLARKYRPTDFSTLIGQEALVRTLSNAIAQGRLAHAYMLTGVRGVGKTTTARILARAFNCEQGPTVTPCGTCDHCRSIAEDSHVDVIEMDAASRTGVNDIRELIEGVRYRPVSARYKIYIIDEVHMLSVNAFNALLKTLEEPPTHVKFIFATTEIRKVPVTVLSRCQRFDLRRIDEEVLARHFAKIAENENVAIEPEALALIARAADGSARDGLSLLDQMIGSAEKGLVEVEKVRAMLGLANRAQLFELSQNLFSGKPKETLELLTELHHAGADPVVILQDLLDLVHWVTRAKVTPDILHQVATSQIEREQGGKLAEGLSIPALGRAWQMLLKGLTEVQISPDPAKALEMVLIRFMHISGLPTPGEIIRTLEEKSGGNYTLPPASISAPGGQGRSEMRSSSRMSVASAPKIHTEEMAAPISEAKPIIQSFADMVALAQTKKEGILFTNLTNIHLVRFEIGRIEFRPSDTTPPSFANRLSAALLEWTGQRWLVSISNEQGETSIKEQKQAVENARLAKAKEHPLVQEVLRYWPDAKIEQVSDLSIDIMPIETDEMENME